MDPRLSDKEAKTKETQEEKTKRLNQLVTRLMADSQAPYHFPKPSVQFNPKKVIGFTLREDVTKAEDLLINTFYDDKKEIKGDYVGLTAQIDAVKNSYEELEQIQNKYFDNILRGNNPTLSEFKTAQANKIKECEDKLKQLSDAAKTLPVPGGGVVPPNIATAIDQQKNLLKTLPDKIEKDQDEFIKKLENQKHRNQSERADKEINEEFHDTTKIFVPYFNPNLKVGSFERKMEGSDPAALVEAGDKKKVAISEGYKNAKKLVLDEMARAEREPPHESFFSPFGMKEEFLDFVIKRKKNEKDGTWSLEPETLNGYEIRTPAEFMRMIQTIFKFQRFAGCETDAIVLSYEKPVYGKTYANERADQLIKLIKYLQTIAKEDRMKAKELQISEASLIQLFSNIGPKKREAIKAGLLDLKRLAKERDDELEKIAEKTKKADNLVDVKEIKAANDELNKHGSIVPDDKKVDRFELDNPSKLEAQYKIEHEKRGLGGGGGVGGESAATLTLGAVGQSILDDSKLHSHEAKEEKMKDLLTQEMEKTEELYNALDKAQKSTKEYYQNIEKMLVNDPSNPNLGELKEELASHEKNTRLLHEKLQENCQRWKNVNFADISNPVLNLLGQEIVKDDGKKDYLGPVFVEKMKELEDKVTSLKADIDLNQTKVKEIEPKIDDVIKIEKEKHSHFKKP